MALKKTAKKKSSKKKTAAKNARGRVASAKKKVATKKAAKRKTSGKARSKVKPKAKVRTKPKTNSKPKAKTKKKSKTSAVARKVTTALEPTAMVVAPLQGDADSDLGKIIAAHKLLTSRNYAEAIEVCEKILETNPGSAEAMHILGLCSFIYGDQGRALTLIEHAHEIDPDCRDYADALSYIYTYVGKLTDGLYYAKLSQALEPHPDIPGLTPHELRDYGGILSKASDPGHYLAAMKAFVGRDFEGAIAACDKELRLNRENAKAYHLLGRALLETGRYARSVSSFHAAIHLDPSSGLSRAYLGEALFGLGRHAEAKVVQEEAQRLAPDDMEVLSCVLRGLSYIEGAGKRDYKKCLSSAQYAQKQNKKVAWAPGRKVRVGYVSDSFYASQHNDLIEPLLRYHDRASFNVHCYVMNSIKDTVTARHENYVSVWRNIFDFDEDVVFQIIERDQIDILVDLCFNDESQVMNIFARGPAAKQLAWIGRSDAVGLPGMTDYLTDAVLADVDAACAAGKAAPHILEGGVFRSEPLSPHMTSGESPFLSDGTVTFGGISDLSQLTPEVVKLWSDVLQAYPFARLHLGLASRRIHEVQMRIMDMFAHFGVMERVSFQEVASNDGKAETIDDLYINFFRSVDVFLDTVPVNCSDAIPVALWMGVPVVTLKGDRRSGSLTASMLTSAGKSEWVAETPDQFVQIAGGLVSDPESLRQTRENLQGEVSVKSLFKPWEGVRGIEAVYARLVGA